MGKASKEARGRRGVCRAVAPMLCADSVVMRENTQATVYGCRRILRYEEERICLHIGKRSVCICGEDLVCTSFSAGAVTVEGWIDAVRFCNSDCHGACDGEVKP